MKLFTRMMVTIFGMTICFFATTGNSKSNITDSSKSQSEEKMDSQPNQTKPEELPMRIFPEKKLDEDSPTYVIQKYTEELRNMLGVEQRKSKVTQDSQKEEQIVKKVRQFFDFTGLAEMSLGDRWKKISTKDQKEFSELFVRLVEESYIQRSRDLVGDYKISFENEKVTGNQAKVTCRVARDDANIDIVYELHRKPKDWMIFNIVLDNVDLIRNYQSQFNRIIGTSGFSELIKLMRKKLTANGDPKIVL